AVVFGRDVDEREAGLRLRTAQISELDLGRIGRGCGPREKKSPRQQDADQGTLRSEGCLPDETAVLCLNHDRLYLCYPTPSGRRMRRIACPGTMRSLACAGPEPMPGHRLKGI